MGSLEALWPGPGFLLDALEDEVDGVGVVPAGTVEAHEDRLFEVPA